MYTIVLLVVFITKTMASNYEGVVFTTSGPIQGRLVYDLGVSYYSFQGIPYAENPTGDLRFKPSVPKEPWYEVLDATKTGPVCIQAEGTYKNNQMSENCLFLNIYVPTNWRKTLHPMPVLVFIHGGEFKSLSGNDDYIYGPQLLLEGGFIVITVNYRLGALGFLSLGIEDASGNAGIKDVLLALQWVKVNIERFGGNSDKITLGGHSAGAALVHYLTLTTKSKGLFNQAVLISGSALGYRFFARHPVENAVALGKQLNIQTNDTYELLKKLKEKDAFDIIQAQNDMGQSDNRQGIRPFAPFVPCIEIECSSAIITKNPIEIIKSGIPQNVPILAGINSDEGIKMLKIIQENQTLIDILNENFELCIPSNIEYPYGSEESRKLASTIKQFYFAGENITNTKLQGFVEFIRETQYSFSVDYWIRLHKQRKNSNNFYYYVLNFDGDLNWFKIINNIDFPGTSHADELGYIFVTSATRSKLENLDLRNKRMVHILQTVLANFIHTGNPTPCENDIGVIWPEAATNGKHVILRDHPVNITDFPPFYENLLFWYNTYDEYNEYLKSGGEVQNKIVP